MRCWLLLLRHCLTMILFICESRTGPKLTLSWLFVHVTQISYSSSFCHCWILLPQLGEIKAFKAFRSLKAALAQLSSAYLAQLRSEQTTTPSSFPASPPPLPANSQNGQGTKHFGRQRGQRDMFCFRLRRATTVGKARSCTHHCCGYRSGFKSAL